MSFESHSPSDNSSTRALFENKEKNAPTIAEKRQTTDAGVR